MTTNVEAIQTIATQDVATKQEQQRELSPIEKAANDLDLLSVCCELIERGDDQTVETSQLFNEALIALNLLAYQAPFDEELEHHLRWSKFKNTYRVHNDAGIVFKREMFFKNGKGLERELELDNDITRRSYGFDTLMTYYPIDPNNDLLGERICISVRKDESIIHELIMSRSNYSKHSNKDTGVFHYTKKIGKPF
jgi:hypothetical protein